MTMARNQLRQDFYRDEFACVDGCGFDTVDVETLNVLQAVRDHFGAAVTITGPNRCRVHNIMVRGAPNSEHMNARAADFRVDGVDAITVAMYLENKYPGQYGIGCYDNRTHIDTRSGGPARWDNRIAHG